MSHDEHTDSRGIIQLITQAGPRHVVLVHGAEAQVSALQPIVEQRLHIRCSAPKVLETVELGLEAVHEISVSPQLLHEAQPMLRPPVPGESIAMQALAPDALTFSGVFRKRGREAFELYDRSVAGVVAAGFQTHAIRYRHEVPSLKLSLFREA